jgi:hypothetical protein
MLKTIQNEDQDPTTLSQHEEAAERAERDIVKSDQLIEESTADTRTQIASLGTCEKAVLHCENDLWIGYDNLRKKTANWDCRKYQKRFVITKHNYVKKCVILLSREWRQNEQRGSEKRQGSKKKQGSEKKRWSEKK